MQKVLLLEDDISMGNGIKMALNTSNTEIILCRTLAEAKRCILEDIFDLLILDVNLPDGNGLELLSKVRQTSSVPIILLTANDMEMDIVNGLESGADDYITKPFSLAVLRARVNTQLRRTKIIKPSTIEMDGFWFDFEHMEFRKEGHAIELSKTEQKLLSASTATGTKKRVFGSAVPSAFAGKHWISRQMRSLSTNGPLIRKRI